MGLLNLNYVRIESSHDFSLGYDFLSILYIYIYIHYITGNAYGHCRLGATFHFQTLPCHFFVKWFPFYLHEMIPFFPFLKSHFLMVRSPRTPRYAAAAYGAPATAPATPPLGTGWPGSGTSRSEAWRGMGFIPSTKWECLNPINIGIMIMGNDHGYRFLLNVEDYNEILSIFKYQQ